MISMGKQMGSTMSMGSTGSTETESSLESCGKDSASTSSSLSTSSCEPASSITSTSIATASNLPLVKSPEVLVPPATRIPPRFGNACPTISSTDLGTAISQELQRRAQQVQYKKKLKKIIQLHVLIILQRSLNATKAAGIKEQSAPLQPKKMPNVEATRSQENKVTHDKLMEEFKRAHKKMFNQEKVQFSDQVLEQVC